MSTLSPQIRSRIPRWSDAPGLRSRLSLVPPRAVHARRTPFVVLIFGILVAGVVGLLMFNTQMQQAAFHATALQDRATALKAEQQQLDMELQQLQDPQRLAQRARRLGMVVPASPAFVQLSDGKILGTPQVTTPADAMRINGFAAPKPADLSPKTRVVHVRAPVTPVNSSSGHGAASTAGQPAQGMKKKH
ncbi:FtsB family cell division protein [Nocardioides terrisoli]|uniref:FtsB family cell division protein n=1 Tax=Nocardioides terrisoli TaxID=3388267 RepID=UPI00287BADEF|nr:septum formation initiator family protein [Nocardioides marmorisolisilvae]